MEFEEFIVKNLSEENIPILFIGSGFTKRYCRINDLPPPDWEELLKQIVKAYSTKEFEYNLLKNEVLEEIKEGTIKEVPKAIIYQKLATKIEKKFNVKALSEELLDKDLEKEILEIYRKNTDLSPMKIYISIFFSKLKITEDPVLLEELKKLNIISKKSFIILTTNYDQFLESIFKEYDVVKGQELITSSTIGNIFKVHGCVTSPETIIITEEDYEKIRTRQKVMNARLVTFFAEHPVFFLGYSLDDLNIQEFMNQVYYSFSDNTEAIKKISEKFLVVEWEKNQKNTIVENATLMKEYKMPLKKMETDNFKKIFEGLDKLKINVSIKELKAAEGVLALALKGNKEKNLKFVNFIDISRLDKNKLLDRDVVVGYGTQLLNCIYNGQLNAFQIIEYKKKDIIIDSEDFMKVYLPDLKKRNTNGVIPFFYYFKDCYNELENFDEEVILALLVVYKRLKKCIDKIKVYKPQNEYRTITEIEKNVIHKSHKMNQILYMYYNNTLFNEDVRKHVHAKLAENNDSIDSYLKKLIALYDMKVYSSQEMISKLDKLLIDREEKI